MANMFEKPVAANPISQFVGLPLEFMNSAIQQRQQQYDKAKADMDQLEDSLLKTNALSGDRVRQQAILKGFDDELTSISETGDLSQVQGKLDNLKRNINREMQYGELGAINKNFASAGAYNTNLGKLYENKKINKSGSTLGARSISEFRTTPNEDGSWSSFKGYTPSNLINPTKALSESIKAIHAKFDEKGQEFVGADDVINNLNSEMANNPEILNSLRENFLATYKGDNPAEDFKKHYKETIESAVKDATYKKKLKAVEGGKGSKKEIRGRQWGRVVMPNTQGELSAKGGDASGARSFIGNFGRNTTDVFENYKNSAEGEREIKFMEWKSRTDFPESYAEQVEWIEKNAGSPLSGELITETIPESMARNILSDNGDRLTNGTVRNIEGKIMDREDQMEIFGSDDKGHKAVVGGQVSEASGHPYGSTVIIGKDGETYIQETTDTEILGSTKFARNRLNTVKNTNTGRKTINFARPIVGTKGVVINPGSYEATYDPKGGITTLRQNGVDKYMYGKDDNGNNVIVKVPEK